VNIDHCPDVAEPRLSADDRCPLYFARGRTKNLDPNYVERSNGSVLVRRIVCYLTPELTCGRVK
jgi:hypothetical protein